MKHSLLYPIWTGQLFSCSVTTVLIMNWQTITFMKLISWNVEETWGNHTISLSHINIHYRYWDPYYYRRRRIQKEDDGMNFIESVCLKNWIMSYVYWFRNKLNLMNYLYVGFLICIWGWWSKSRNWRREVEVGNTWALSSVVRYFQRFFFFSPIGCNFFYKTSFQ